MVELGPYQLSERVATGATAEVWRAVHAPTDTPVAVKVARVDDPAFVAALHGEAAVLASFRSPYVVAVHDFGVVSAHAARDSQGRLPAGHPWLATEWLPHGTLRETRPTDWTGLRRVLLDVLLGLAHAHARGVLHRDVRAGNVLVAAQTPLRARLGDFGIALARDRGPRGPEGPWIDLYGVGRLADELSSGPDGGSPLEVPDAFRAWCDRLLEPRAADRFPTAPAAIEALLAVDRRARLHRRHWSADLDPESPPPRGADDPGPGVFANRHAPFVGREAERDRLWNLLYDVTVDGRPRIALVRGPSGVGTSGLGQWLCERVAETGAATAVRGEARAPRPLLALLAHHLGGVPRSADDVVPALPEPVDATVTALRRWAGDDRPPARSEVFPVVARVLARGGAPLVVWIDGYEGELLAFARWVVATRAAPALFVFTESDERLLGPEPDRAGPPVEELPLAPLSPDTTVRLVQAFGAVDQATAVRIADRSAGFPRLSVEILRSLAAAGALRSGQAGWKASRRATLPVPDGPRALGEQRLDEVLAKVPRSLPALGVLSVLGMDASVEEWRAVCRRARILIPDALVPHLLRTRLVTVRAGEPRPAQPALLEAIAARTEDRRPALHRLAAEVLEASGADPVRIGRHLFLAGAREEARPWLQRALAQRGDLVRHGVCLDLLEQLVPADSPERIPLLFARIERARVSGRVDAAFDAVRRLLVLAKVTGDPHGTARALMQRAVLRVEGGDEEGAIRDAREAAELVRTHGAIDAHTRQTLDWYGLVLGRTGRLRESRAVLEGRESYLARFARGHLALDEGEPREARRWFALAAEVLDADPLNAALLRCGEAEAHREEGRLDTAEGLARTALTELSALQTTYVGDARVCLGLVHLAQGRWAQAEVVLRPTLADNDDARRAAVAGLALATARQGRDPLGWLRQFDPRGLRMSLSIDRTLAATLDAVAATPGVPAGAASLARAHASVVAARARPVT